MTAWRGRWRWLGLAAAVGVVAAGLAAVRRARLEPMLVRGESMRPTLVPGQRIAVGPPTRPLRRGAVVVVRLPGGAAGSRSGIKPGPPERAAGVSAVALPAGQSAVHPDSEAAPASSVARLAKRRRHARSMSRPPANTFQPPCLRGSCVLPAGQPAGVPWSTGDLEVVKRVVGLPGERVGLLSLGPDEYFVLGDNRDASTDGRAFGPVGWDRIVGEVRFAYWPPRRLRPRRQPNANAVRGANAARMHRSS